MRVLLLCIALALLHALPAWSAEVLILQSTRSSCYTEALRGFDAAAKASSRVVVLSDYAEVDVVRMVKEERPRVVVAMGDRAFAAAKKVREVPVVCLLSLSLTFQKQLSENIGGVAMVAAPEQYLKLIDSFRVRRFGILYDPSKTGRYLKRVEQESKQLGLQLVAEQVSSPREMQAKLEKLKGSVDLLWILPDSTVFTTVNMEAFMLFSITNNVPVVTFSSQYLSKGAAASVSIDYHDLGAQAGEMAHVILESGGPLRKVPTVDPRKSIIQTNDSVIRKLGIQAPSLFRSF